MEIFKKKKRLPEPQPEEELEAAAFLPSASECAEAAAEEKAAEEAAKEAAEEKAEKEAAPEEEAAAEEAALVEPAPEEEKEAEPLTLEILLQSMSPEGIELFRQALADAELRGRNTAVEEHLLTADDSDGIPHPGSGNASFAAGRPTSIFDLAREAL